MQSEFKPRLVILKNMKLTWCEVDDGIKHPLKYFCLGCYHLKGQYRHNQQGMESEC